MKKLFILLFLLLFVSSALPQVSVKTVPNYNTEWIWGDGGTWETLCAANTTTNGFAIEKEEGAITIWFLSDTTDAAALGANQSDSCLTVNLQLYDTDVGGWGGYYGDFTTNYSKLDTIDRAIVNVAHTNYYYMVLAEFTEWASADSGRLVLGIGVGDSLNIKVLKAGF